MPGLRPTRSAMTEICSGPCDIASMISKARSNERLIPSLRPNPAIAPPAMLFPADITMAQSEIPAIGLPGVVTFLGDVEVLPPLVALAPAGIEDPRRGLPPAPHGSFESQPALELLDEGHPFTPSR